MTASKVKVSTEKLLESVKARRASIVAEYERAVDKYEKDHESYGAKVLDALKRAQVAAEKGKLPDAQRCHYEGRYGNALLVQIRATTPTKPTLNTTRIDRLVKTLEMASDDTLTISAEDAAEYLG